MRVDSQEEARMSKSLVRIQAAIAFGSALAVAPALAVDAGHGGDLAKRWCAACHVVSDDQARGADTVPTFASIAHRPGVSAESIATFLRDPHPKMPDMSLTTFESGDLAAYIASLAKK